MFYLLQSSGKSQQKPVVVTLQHTTVEQLATHQDKSAKHDVIPGGKADIDSKPETAGFSTRNSCVASAPVDSSCTDVGSLSFSIGNTCMESTAASVAGDSMNMSVDDHGNFASVAEKPDSSSKTVKPKSGSSLEGCVPHVAKPAPTHELMEGSFRDELRSCYGDNVSSDSTSVAKADSFKSFADKSSVKTASSAAQNHIKKGGLIKSTGDEDGKPDSRLMAPVSFSDVARAASVSEHRSSTNDVNDSYAYRDQSAILISDDDDDDDDDNDEADSGSDKRADKTRDFWHLNADTQTACSSEQKSTFEAREKDMSSKTLPEFKQQTSKSEVSTDIVCQPSTIITIRPPAGVSAQSVKPSAGISAPAAGISAQSVKPSAGISAPAAATSATAAGTSAQSVNTVPSNIDVEKMIARRETVSKLLNQKKVSAFIIMYCVCFNVTINL